MEPAQRKTDLGGQASSAFQGLLRLRLFFSFIIAYVVGNFLFWLGLQSVNGDGSRLAAVFFLTSPVNLYENFTGGYSSVSQGLLANFAFTAVMLALIEVYCRVDQVRLRGRFSVDRAFVASVASSYLLSVIVWVWGGFPAYGSSIIGFCMTAFLLINTLLDARAYTQRSPGTEFRQKRFLWMVALAFSVTILPIGYVIGNAGFPLHLGGLALFSVILFMTRLRFPKASGDLSQASSLTRFIPATPRKSSARLPMPNSQSALTCGGVSEPLRLNLCRLRLSAMAILPGPFLLSTNSTQTSSSIGLGDIWNFLNSNLIAVILATLIGVFVATYVQIWQSNRTDAQMRKQVALLLGYEIAQMREIANSSVLQNSKLLEEYKKEIASGDRHFLTLTDMVWSRVVYDRPTLDLTLLPSDIVAVVTDVYRRLEVCNHIQGLAENVAAKGNSLMPNFVGVPDDVYKSAEMAPVLREIDMAINQFIQYSESYFANVRNLVGQCDKALAGLSRIARIDKSMVAKTTTFNPDAPRER